MPAASASGASTQVLVTYLNGDEARGGVENFNPRLPAFFLHRGRGEPTLRVLFEAVRTVAFLHGPASGRAAGAAAGARLVTVRFLDGFELSGVTHHSEGPRRGLFLIPSGLEGVDRLYAPISAIREVVSVQRLGEILTEQKIATPEMVASALLQQQRLREQPLGQILLGGRAITDDALQQVLSLQRERRDLKIGEILIDQGFITAGELERALGTQRRQRGRKLGELMVEMGYVSHKMVGIALAIQYNVPFLSLASRALDPDLRRLVPSALAFHWQLLPIEVAERVLTVAVADPAETGYKDALMRTTGLAVTEVVATPQDLSRTILEFYRDQGGEAGGPPAG